MSSSAPEHMQPQVLDFPSALKSIFEAASIHVTVRLLESNLMDFQRAKLISISLNMKNEQPTIMFVEPRGAMSIGSSFERRQTCHRSTLRHCDAGPIPLVMDRSIRFAVSASCSVQECPRSM